MTGKEQRQPQHLFPCLTSSPPHSSGLYGEKEGREWPGEGNESRQAGGPCCCLMNASSNPDKLQLCGWSLLNHPGGITEQSVTGL